MRFLLLCFVLLSGMSFSQKPFHGTLKYKATVMVPDTNIVYKEWNVVIRTNDTIVRVETETEMFGNQVYLRNIGLNKAYLLIELNGVGYAIQNDLSKTSEDKEEQYTITKAKGKKKVAGLKSTKYHIVDRGGAQEGYDCYFTSKIGNKYLEVYQEVPGLATDYYIPSSDGMIHYQLVEAVEETVNRDLFGVPSDYQRITFDDFMNMFISGSGN